MWSEKLIYDDHVGELSMWIFEDELLLMTSSIVWIIARNSRVH